MRTGHFLRWWVGAVLLATVTVGAAAAMSHVREVKEGGLEVVLSDAGCMGGTEPGQRPSAPDCSRTEWLYTHWWVWPLGVLLVGLAIGAVVAIVSFTTSQDQHESEGLFGSETQ